MIFCELRKHRTEKTAHLSCLKSTYYVEAVTYDPGSIQKKMVAYLCY